jgi:hypothetical protein
MLGHRLAINISAFFHKQRSGFGGRLRFRVSIIGHSNEIRAFFFFGQIHSMAFQMLVTF